MFRLHTLSQCAMPGFLIPGILLVSIGFSAGCNQSPPEAAKQPVPKVTVVEAANQETIDFDDYTGRAEASQRVEVRSRLFGYLKSIDFGEGRIVKEDQLLFTVEPDEYEAVHNQSLSRVNVAKTQFDLAKTKLIRREPLVRSGAVTQEEYDEVSASVREADAKIMSAKADAAKTAVDLKYTVIRAPINGRIDRAYVTRGNLLTGGGTNGTLLTKIVQEQPIYVYFDVDERSLLRYMRMRPDAEKKPGNLRALKIACFAQLADERDFPHQGVLDFASTEVESTTGTTRIRGVFKNKELAIASGMFVRVRIPVGKPYQALTIPETAIAKDQSVTYVYVVGSDEKAMRRPIELGGQRGGLRIVLKGLEPGERVITKGLQRVRQGQEVEAEKTTLPTLEKIKLPPPEEFEEEQEPKPVPEDSLPKIITEPAPIEGPKSTLATPRPAPATPAAPTPATPTPATPSPAIPVAPSPTVAPAAKPSDSTAANPSAPHRVAKPPVSEEPIPIIIPSSPSPIEQAPASGPRQPKKGS